jgi:hypothetical protein
MKVLLLSVFALQLMTDLPLTTLSVDAKELMTSFNSAQDKARMIVVLSPT